jgi:hypothetical protein
MGNTPQSAICTSLHILHLPPSLSHLRPPHPHRNAPPPNKKHHHEAPRALPANLQFSVCNPLPNPNRQPRPQPSNPTPRPRPPPRMFPSPFPQNHLRFSPNGNPKSPPIPLEHQPLSSPKSPNGDKKLSPPIHGSPPSEPRSAHQRQPLQTRPTIANAPV